MRNCDDVTYFLIYLFSSCNKNKQTVRSRAKPRAPVQNTQTREISNARKTSHNHSNRDTSHLRCLSPGMEVNTRCKLVPCMCLVFTGMEVNTRCKLVPCMCLIFTRMPGLLRSVTVFVCRLSSADWLPIWVCCFYPINKETKGRNITISV